MKKRFEDGQYCVAGVKLTKDEMIRLKKNAHKHEMTVSEFIRKKTL